MLKPPFPLSHVYNAALTVIQRYNQGQVTHISGNTIAALRSLCSTLSTLMKNKFGDVLFTDVDELEDHLHGCGEHLAGIIWTEMMTSADAPTPNNNNPRRWAHQGILPPPPPPPSSQKKRSKSAGASRGARSAGASRARSSSAARSGGARSGAPQPDEPVLLLDSEEELHPAPRPIAPRPRNTPIPTRRALPFADDDDGDDDDSFGSPVRFLQPGPLQRAPILPPRPAPVPPPPPSQEPQLAKVLQATIASSFQAMEKGIASSFQAMEKGIVSAVNSAVTSVVARLIDSGHHKNATSTRDHGRLAAHGPPPGSSVTTTTTSPLVLDLTKEEEPAVERHMLLFRFLYFEKGITTIPTALFREVYTFLYGDDRTALNKDINHSLRDNKRWILPAVPVEAGGTTASWNLVTKGLQACQLMYFKNQQKYPFDVEAANGIVNALISSMTDKNGITRDMPISDGESSGDGDETARFLDLDGMRYPNNEGVHDAHDVHGDLGDDDEARGDAGDHQGARKRPRPTTSDDQPARRARTNDDGNGKNGNVNNHNIGNNRNNNGGYGNGNNGTNGNNGNTGNNNVNGNGNNNTFHLD